MGYSLPVLYRLSYSHSYDVDVMESISLTYNYNLNIKVQVFLNLSVHRRYLLVFMLFVVKISDVRRSNGSSSLKEILLLRPKDLLRCGDVVYRCAFARIKLKV